MDTERKINEYVLKLQGKVNLPSELKLGNSFKVELDGSVDQIIDEDNDDGTYNRLYRFRPIIGKILYDNGEVTKTKDARKRGQQMRSAIRYEWQASNEGVDENDYYDRRMSGLIQRIINGEI